MPNINKNIIKQAGAAVANATNKAAGLSASTPEPGTIISAIQLVNGGRAVGPGDPVHFVESVRNKLKTLVVDMLPIQDFNGYDHPWPAGGGKNIFDITQITNGSYGGLNYTVSNGIISYSGKATSNGWKICHQFNLPQTGTYHFHMDVTGDGGSFIEGFTDKGADATIVCTDTNTVYRIAFVAATSGQSYSGTIKNIQIETGSTYSGFSPYANICPISGRTGATAYVSPTPNVADATTYAADWTTPAGTVYAGSADIVTGDIKAAPNYASYNGETLVGPWVSSMDVYNPDGTPTTGAQVVDLGGTMTEYHITGHDIITLVGDNYIWSDSGDVTITE